jgi:hypothetical protein
MVRKATVQVMDCGFLVGGSGCLPVKQAITGDYYKDWGDYYLLNRWNR